MPETTIRSLAKAYSKKTIDQAAYREARAKFINGVLAGEATLAVNDYPPLIRPKPDVAAESTLRRYERKAASMAEPAAEPPPDLPAGNKKTILLAGAAAGVVILIIIGIILTVGGDDDIPAVTTSQATITKTPAAPNEAQLLIREFLGQRTWAVGASLDTFVGKWQNLPAETRASASGSLELNQLTNAIYKQLQEERALSAIGNAADAAYKQQKLIDFAKQVGINDPRIAPQ